MINVYVRRKAETNQICLNEYKSLIHQEYKFRKKKLPEMYNPLNTHTQTHTQKETRTHKEFNLSTQLT